jgi:transcriptional regulator with XRE-family HTH domain
MDIGDESKTFWERLSDAYAIKHHVRLTQQKAGKLIGGTQGAAKKWKAGGQPSMENAIQLANLLDVAVEWLLTGRPPRKPLSNLEATLVEWFRNLDDDYQRSEALGMLKANVALAPPPPRPTASSSKSASSRLTTY